MTLCGRVHLRQWLNYLTLTAHPSLYQVISPQNSFYHLSYFLMNEVKAGRKSSRPCINPEAE